MTKIVHVVDINDNMGNDKNHTIITKLENTESQKGNNHNITATEKFNLKIAQKNTKRKRRKLCALKHNCQQKSNNYNLMYCKPLNFRVFFYIAVFSGDIFAALKFCVLKTCKNP